MSDRSLTLEAMLPTSHHIATCACTSCENTRAWRASFTLLGKHVDELRALDMPYRPATHGVYNWNSPRNSARLAFDVAVALREYRSNDEYIPEKFLDTYL